MDVSKMTDQEVVQMAKRFGPGVIGPEVHARAKAIEARNPGGAFGRALVDTEPPKKAEPAKEPTKEPSKPAKGRGKG